MLKFTIDGHKQVFRAKEITKKTFDFWKDRSSELSQHVNGYVVDEDVKIGIYDEIEDFTVIGWELNNTILIIENSKVIRKYDEREMYKCLSKEQPRTSDWWNLLYGLKIL